MESIVAIFCIEDRTLEFSKNITSLIKKYNKDLLNLKINGLLITVKPRNAN